MRPGSAGLAGYEAADRGPVVYEGKIHFCFRNIEAVSRFIYAIDGQIVRNFEPLFQETERGGWHGEPLPEEADLEWETHSLAAALHLAGSAGWRTHGEAKRGSSRVSL